MQSVSSKIWTRVTMSISYDDNHYTTGTSESVVYGSFKKKSSKFLYNKHNNEKLIKTGSNITRSLECI